MPKNAEIKHGQLRLKHVTVPDSGLYVCEGSNSVGRSAHASIEIFVQSKWK